MNLGHSLENLDGFLSPAKLGRDHSQGVVSTDTFRRAAESVSNLLLGLSVLTFSGQDEGKVHMSWGKVLLFLNRLKK